MEKARERENEPLVKGIVDSIVFRNDENGYTICVVDADGEPITLTGVMPGVAEGEMIAATGDWVNHPTYGRQFAVHEYRHELPATSSAILTYLSSGVIKGIGPVTAKRIVDTYGEDTFAVLEEHPEWLKDIKGITDKRAKTISESFREQFGMRQVMLFFGGLLTPSVAVRVYKKWGAAAVDVLRANPYLLCGEIDGIGFEKADAFAMSLGVEKQDAERVAAGVKCTLTDALYKTGDCYLPVENLTDSASEMLGVPREAVTHCLSRLTKTGGLTAVRYGETTAVYLSYVYETEKYVAEKLKELCDTKVDIPLLDPEYELRRAERATGMTFAPRQADAIRFSTSEGVVIVTGGPGTGKTTVIRAILEMFAALDISVSLAAPTGRAAKRMTAATGREAKTLHRLLECTRTDDAESGFGRNEDCPLECGAVIVDEMSMVDLFLFAALLRALKPGTRLLLIGDADQLPPVGAGDVFGNLIACGSFMAVCLTEIFRQEKDSRIITGAHDINNGRLPPLDNKGKDFFFMERQYASPAKELIRELIAARLPKAYGYDCLNDIQVICPSRKGECGTVALNETLRALFNEKSPQKAEYTVKNTVFRDGDKIMQIRNNYEIDWTTPDGVCGSGVFNGDIGYIEHIDTENRTVSLLFDDGRRCECDLGAFEDLEHAYAVTVHKSQGSEYKAVIVPLLDFPHSLMTRNLLYTAVTRAKELVILVGRQHILSQMVANNRRENKRTGLIRMLRPKYVYPESKMKEDGLHDDEYIPE